MRLSPKQRDMLGEKLADLGNLAVGSLVFRAPNKHADQKIPADERAAQVQESQMNIRPPFIADFEPPKAIPPALRAFDKAIAKSPFCP